MPRFDRYVGIDYSGAQTPDSSLVGLRIYLATPSQAPVEVLPPPGRRRYWTRRGVAAWLTGQLQIASPTLVGIDHGFSFPLRYFESHGLALDWTRFLEDFHRHWPTDAPNASVDAIRDGKLGMGNQRTGNPRWRRLTEMCCGAKSVFHFDVQGSVAKSTHCGLPWLRHLQRELGSLVHFWPFDGWSPAPGRSVLVEAYPSLWNRSLPIENRDPHQHDAFAVAHWMREQDGIGSLPEHFHPALTPDEQAVARVEGWIFGLPRTPSR